MINNQENFTIMDKFHNCNDKWLFLKNTILSVVNKIAHLKKIKLKQESKWPWFDREFQAI